MRVDITEPSWLASHGVLDDWWLTGSSCLKHLGIVVSSFTPKHFYIKINLSIDSSGNNSLQYRHDWLLQRSKVVDPTEERKLHDGIPDVAVVKFLYNVRIQILEHSTSIGNQEFSSLIGSLEADKGSSTRRSGSDEFVVHTFGIGGVWSKPKMLTTSFKSL